MKKDELLTYKIDALTLLAESNKNNRGLLQKIDGLMADHKMERNEPLNTALSEIIEQSPVCMFFDEPKLK